MVEKTSPSIRLHASLLLLLALCLLQTFLLPLLLPHLAPTVLLTLLILLTLLLSLATAYLQASVFALASLWGSPQVLAVMSGQGGIAVLVSVTQVILAVISALNTTGTDGDMEGGQSTLAGVGLWALGAMGAFAFMIAHRRLVIHQDYAIILAPIFARQEHADVAGGDSKDNGLGTMTRRIFRKNWMLEFAVAWVFVVTLVSIDIAYNPDTGYEPDIDNLHHSLSSRLLPLPFFPSIHLLPDSYNQQSSYPSTSSSSTVRSTF